MQHNQRFIRIVARVPGVPDVPLYRHTNPSLYSWATVVRAVTGRVRLC